MSLGMRAMGVVAPVFGRVMDRMPISVEKQREAGRKLEQRIALPPDVTVTDETIGGCDVLRFSAGGGDRGLVLYFHGGAYIAGSRNAGRAYADLVTGGGADLLSAEYRLAPEHPFPAGLDDAVAVYREVVAGIPASKVVVMGDSAGGGLVLALMARLRDEGLPMPAGLVPIFPWADLELRGETMRTNRNKDMLTTKSLGKAALDYAGGQPLDHVGISPVHADVSGFPRSYIPVGTRDMLLSDARLMTSKLQEAGVDVTLKEWPGCVHGFTALRFAESKAARAEIRRFVEDVLGA